MAGVLEQQITDRWAIYNGDSMEVMAGLPDDSIHASIYSPPFGGLYHYSSSDRDLSNVRNYDEFFEMYEHFVQEKMRITIPGRCSGVHAALTPSVSSAAFSSYIDFPGDVIRLHQKIGWEFVARHVIWKEPLGVRRRTMQKNLAHMAIVQDGSAGGVAAPDELLVFRKPGAAEPVRHPCGLTGVYAGEETIPADLLKYRGWEGDQKLNRYSHWIWRRYASSVWDDVRINRVLPFRDSKDQDDEKHVHPLQLDVIERFIDLRTMPGERVLTPFMGVGSEVYTAVRMGRMGIGAELKPSYYQQAVRNLAAVDAESRPEDVALFDLGESVDA
jgi:DNA modification methylase